MHRIDENGNQAGFFRRQNSNLNQLATVMGADWPNAVQEEIIAVLTAAGIDPIKGNNTQLLAAIQTIMAGGMMLEGKFMHTTHYDATRWVEPHGQTLNRADWPEAWAAIQASGMLAEAADRAVNRGKFGTGDGVSTFDMPDLRDQFLRIYKDARVGAVGPSLGGFKANQNKSHTHTIGEGQIQGLQPNGHLTSGDDYTNTAAWEQTTSESGGDEAVPDHTAVIYVIRMK